MQLWNDYEGKTIANDYSVGTLLRPEGRNGLFALANGPDAPAIIRLTESLNDEDQMMACWRRVTQVKQGNLLPIKRFGETNFEGTPLTYVVMEQTDANLDDLLKERPLTHAEAIQLASSVIPALQALHAENLVHEHVEAGHIVAVGETIKLRTDCVRECIIGADHMTAEECAELKQRDVQNFAELLLRALTLERKLKPGITLQAPFDQIIRKGIEGSWGLDQISSALKPHLPVPAPVAAPAKAAVPVPSAATVKAAVPVPAAAPPAVPAASASAVPVATPAPAPIKSVSPAAAAEQMSLKSLESGDAPGEQPHTAPDPLIYQRRVHNGVSNEGRRVPIWGAFALAAIVILAFVLRSVHSKSSAATTPHASAAVPAKSAPQPLPKRSPATPAAVVASAQSPAKTTISGHVEPGWYVIAYTFNHEEQAWKRAEAILQRHPSLRPQVIAPNGHKPFLVALGGPMSRDQAENIRAHARQSGLPRDTFVRNY